MAYTNSTIKLKKGDCRTCDSTDVPLIADRCSYCYWRNVREKSAQKRINNTNPHPTDFRARSTGTKEPSGKALGEWFMERRKEMTGTCCNCGEPSSKHSDAFFIFSIAHVLPKSKNSGFPSVSQHPQNWIELCHICHTRFDSSWHSAASMPCFPLAIEKFKIIEPFIDKEERRRIPECFLK